MSEEIKSKMNSILQEKSQLQKKVSDLEETQSSLGFVPSERVAEVNSFRVRKLLLERKPALDVFVLC